MKKGDYLTTILRSDSTVFTIPEITMLWREKSDRAVRVRLSYYVRKGGLYRIRRGLYAKDDQYDQQELATKIFTPAYVSFETVLAEEGIIFQYQNKLTVASYLTRVVEIENQKYEYKKIKDKVLIDKMGVRQLGKVAKASDERAVLDTLYIYGDYQFDNLREIDWELVFKMVPIYDNKRLVKTVNDLYKKTK